MTSERRIVANRQNALRSTGARTPEGKMSASKNAVKHGILSREVLLPGENGAALEALREKLIVDLAPVGELEMVLVDQMVVCVWKLRRIHVLEAGVFELRLRDHVEIVSVLPKAKLSPAGVLAQALVKDGHQGDQLSKLSRYEAMLERGLFRALHELQRVQAARLGRPVALPVAVDVSLAAPDMAAGARMMEEGTSTLDQMGGNTCGGAVMVRNEATPGAGEHVGSVDVAPNGLERGGDSLRNEPNTKA